MIGTIPEMMDYLRAEQPVDTTLVAAGLDSAHTLFYDMCSRSFEVADTTATARSYVPSGTDVLRIHDCTTITGIVSNGTVITGFQKEPFGPTWAGETRPYEQVRLLGTWWYPTAYTQQATVVVTATWGWLSTPAPAVDAVKVMCKDIVTNRDLRGGLVSFGDAVAVARRNPFVLGVVERYGRVESVGIA